jgi:hypothetical protein
MANKEADSESHVFHPSANLIFAFQSLMPTKTAYVGRRAAELPDYVTARDLLNFLGLQAKKFVHQRNVNSFG